MQPRVGIPLPFSDQNFPLFPEKKGKITTLARISVSNQDQNRLLGLKTAPSPDRNREKHTREGGTSPVHKV